MTIRLWHTYIGVFIAPSVLCFALTGALQVFSLHEAHGAYHPPVLLEKLGSVHKDQVFTAKEHPPTPPDAAEEDDDKPKPTTVVLKGFFLLVALGLALSTAFGLWMALTQARRRRTAWTLLFAGTAIPVSLLVASLS